ncbi:MAG: hypothetical protein EPO12_21890 [Aquabacterium sp.]|nr:MAG: hypothetical protein EPO12_21890 [Aquabacterium sp.]
MDAAVLRLVWALPLVLVVGVGLIYALKRLGLGTGPSPAAAELSVVSRQQLSEHTQALVLQSGAQRWLVVESTATVSVQALGQGGAGQVSQPAWPLGTVRRT